MESFTFQTNHAYKAYQAIFAAQSQAVRCELRAIWGDVAELDFFAWSADADLLLLFEIAADAPYLRQGTGKPLQPGAFNEIPAGVFTKSNSQFVAGAVPQRLCRAGFVGGLWAVLLLR